MSAVESSPVDPDHPRQ